MNITIREASPEVDFERIAELLSVEASEPVPVHELLEEEKSAVSYFKEQNDSANAPMLAINRKLGYVRQEGLGHYGLVRELA